MNTQTVNESQDRFSTLRQGLRVNAAFSAVSGVGFLVAGEALSRFTGLEPVGVFTAVGIVVLLYALDLVWLASRPEIDLRLGVLTVILDAIWVVGSILILLTGWPPLTTAGRWTVALIAELVAVFAIWQAVGVHRARR